MTHSQATGGTKGVPTEGVLRPSVKRWLGKGGARQSFKNRVCSFATTNGTRIDGRRKVLIGSRGRHLIHRLVRHVGMDHRGLHLVFKGVQTLGKFLDVAIHASVGGQPGGRFQPRFLPFTRPTLHRNTTKLAHHSKPATIGARLNPSLRARIATDL